MGNRPAGSIFAESFFFFFFFFFFIEKSGVQDKWGRHRAKRSSDPRLANPEFKLQVRDLLRVVGIVAPVAPLGVGTWGKCFIESQG